MNEGNSVILSSETDKNIQSRENKTAAKEARELLKNGILVETNKGLVCMSLNDALHKGVGGHTLSVEDFQTVATELLFQEEPKETGPDTVSLWTQNTTKKFHKKSNINMKESVNKGFMACVVPDSFSSSQSDIVEDFQNSMLSFSSLEYSFLNKDVEESEELSTNIKITESAKIFGNRDSKKPLVNKRSLILRNNIKPVISVEKIVKNSSNQTTSKENYKTNKFGSVLINSIKNSRSVVSDNVSCEDTSDNSEVMPVVTEETGKPPKKRGGWPKGRKRKPEVKYEIRPPKAPATGYVIFLNEKRKEYRDMPFTEVTKLLGNEWSRLSLPEKKIYLDQAEVEKKRYREELKLYRQSDAYRTYLHKKRLKRLQGHGTEESDMDATDEIDDEDNEELYCRSCDQWFHSLHNKKEHLYGRQHLQSIAGRYTKMSDPDWCNPNMSSTSLDESSLDGSSYLRGSKDHCCKDKDSLNMDDAIVRFMVANKEREEERNLLRKKLEESKAKNQTLSLELQQLNETVDSLTCMVESEKTTQILLEQRLFNLLNVPTLFYLPEPLSEDNN